VRSVSSFRGDRPAAKPHRPRFVPFGGDRPAVKSRGLRDRVLLVVSVVGVALLATGCRHIGVKAHQRELLADRIMKLDGNAQEQAADEHILSNREGAIGGSGTAGGGCGCN
jgi:hypothetical protein